MVESTDKQQPEKAVTEPKDSSTAPASTAKASTAECVSGETTTTASGKGTKAKTTVDPSAARKRRKAIIESQRKESEEAAQKESEQEAKQKGKASAGSGEDDDDDSGDESDNNNGDESSGTTPNGRKRKSKRTQIRYDPDVPMSKEQLAAWRREARRVRNRESAAASRQRIRNRITELETEVDDYKSKYHAALDRLKELEDLAKAKKRGGNNADKETTGAAKDGSPEVGKA